MPRNKDLKRLVRARMGKTGESYTAARVRILAKSKTAAPIDYSGLAGMKDGPLAKKTGRTWEQWVRVLDRDGAGKMTHRDIATLVSTKYEVGDWWSQTVTVGSNESKVYAREGTGEMAATKRASREPTTYPWRDCSMRGRTRASDSDGSTT
jgi:hypothetical protein